MITPAKMEFVSGYPEFFGTTSDTITFHYIENITPKFGGNMTNDNVTNWFHLRKRASSFQISEQQKFLFVPRTLMVELNFKSKIIFKLLLRTLKNQC